jgi:hypothetical protein
MQEFFAWMDELNREALRRGYPDWPLPDEVAHDLNCWIEDFERGLTPAQALDANSGGSSSGRTLAKE